MKAPVCMVLMAASLPISPGFAESADAAAEPRAAAMQPLSAYPIIVTSDMAECREFYTRHLGFKVIFDASWFVYMESQGPQPYAVAFMTPDHPSRPPGPEAFDGKGMFLTVQVADAAAEHARLEQAGVTIAYPLKDEAWGQRRFGLFDPSGMWVDVVEQIEPAAGFWDKYMTQ